MRYINPRFTYLLTYLLRNNDVENVNGNDCMKYVPVTCFLFCFLQLLHKSVDMVEKRLTGSSGILTLKCKDFQTLKLEIPTADDCLNIAASVESLSNIGLICLCYFYLTFKAGLLFLTCKSWLTIIMTVLTF